ncbi:unnamed protein product [Dracunculus medinensis]|uniref:diacylglycerol O-acyltransferase n=1 Tax=Dracunculus medinensis TaxID=318479 RepID=A0A0N4U156_DRAME|nr:unnamed protein product [Dracunculus medinensis]
MIYDWRSPHSGGYKWNPLRDQSIYKHFVNYFPVKLHKTAELPAGKNYLIVSHPHGIIAMSTVINFCTNATGIQEKLPLMNIKVCTLMGQFLVPLRRELILLHGMISCSKNSLKHLLNIENQINNIVVLVVGGAEEALDAYPGSHILTLKNRKGFIKTALETGAHLVPCYSFGETDLYQQAYNPPGSTIRNIQTRLKKLFGFSPPLFYGRGIFNCNFGFLPYRKAINTVIGAPIPIDKKKNPSKEKVDELHKLYINKLINLFEDHKTKFGVPKETKLIIK